MDSTIQWFDFGLVKRDLVYVCWLVIIFSKLKITVICTMFMQMTEVLEVWETSMKEVLGSYYRGKLEEQEC